MSKRTSNDEVACDFAFGRGGCELTDQFCDHFAVLFAASAPVNGHTA
jgi:hypothetical protein